jgi:aconitate hydratase
MKNESAQNTSSKEKFNVSDFFETFSDNNGKSYSYFSLKKLERSGHQHIARFPLSIRVLLESVARNLDGKKVEESHLKNILAWKPNDERTEEVPFVVARVLLQDFTGVPLGVDLATMRSVVQKLGKDASVIEPLVQVDLVIDHSVQVDFARSNQAFAKNLTIEFERNLSRYEFLKWCMESFKSFKVVPPGIGICHQVNLEYLGQCAYVSTKKSSSSKTITTIYPDTLVGTDSHTTMINGLGVVGWGVGGIEAEAAMLGQPVYLLTPDVVGVHLKGRLPKGSTATDLVLHITELLRKIKVVGKFVEFFGEGARHLSVPDRATISNMCPEYGATIGFFPVDDKTCEYLKHTGRSDEHVKLVKDYYTAVGMFGIPLDGEIDYSTVVELDLSQVHPCIAGPKRPQDRIVLNNVKKKFIETFTETNPQTSFGKTLEDLNKSYLLPGNVFFKDMHIKNGDVLIAAITSCTNTSNPSVMLAAGILAKKACEKGLQVNPKVKSSLAPGSRAVTEYLTATGLQPYLDKLGFNLVGYGCTTCIGNSGPLDKAIEDVILKENLVGVSVLSGNRNFEARVHQNIKANFLMSPPLVVAYALAGSILIDLATEPLGIGLDGQGIYLKDIWPEEAEIEQYFSSAFNPDTYRNLYNNTEGGSELWNKIESQKDTIFEWDKSSTYIQEPPYFVNFNDAALPISEIKNARALAIFGDSVTTDHISPAGAIKLKSPAGAYLTAQGVAHEDFNSYGARRGNHEVMVRGTFANVRIKNLMLQNVEGGYTLILPEKQQMTIFEASEEYKKRKIPLVVFAGQEYGTGSSRDWAAKGTMLLGVKAVIAESFERIHRSNLVGMGILPCQFIDGASAASLGIDGSETFSILSLNDALRPRQKLILQITSETGIVKQVEILLRIDTQIEIEYYKRGGILPYVLSEILT